VVFFFDKSNIYCVHMKQSPIVFFIRTCKIFFITAVVLSTQTHVFAGNTITVTRGPQSPAAVINWNVIGGSLTCTGTTGYPITSPDDGVNSNWTTGAPHGSNGSITWNNVYAPAGTYTFTCADTLSPFASDSATMTVLGCSGATPVWNGTSCVAGGIINGVCSAGHYGCSAGTSASNGATGAAWTWSCAGSGGGTTASCSEAKASCGGTTPTWGGGNCSAALAGTASGNNGTATDAVGPYTGSATYACDNGVWTIQGGSTCSSTPTPDVTAGTVSPSTGAVGSPTVLTASITNVGSASTGASFDNFIQVSNSAGGAGPYVDLTSVSMGTLAAGTSNTTSKSYTFPSAGTFSVRACADKTSSAGGGVIAESDETNNCGLWSDIAIVGTSGTLASTATCTIPNGSATCPAHSFTWTTTNPIGTSQVVANGSTGHDSTPANNATQSLPVNYGGETYQLYNNAVSIATKTVTADCLSSSAWNGSTCQACANGGCTAHVCNNGASNAPICINSFNITSSAGANGTISPLGVTPVDEGTDQTFTITPNGGYHTVSLVIDGVTTGALSTYTFVNVQAIHTISATFAFGPAPSGAFSGTPNCTIATNSSNCNTVVSWTSSNTTNVTLTDCAGGVYVTKGTGAQSNSITIPYPTGCYQIHDGLTAAGTLLDQVNGTSGCTVGGWDTSGLKCVDPRVVSVTVTGDHYTNPGTITFVCSGADGWIILKDGLPFSSGAGAPVPISVNTTGNYSVICTTGTYQSPPVVRQYNTPPPPTGNVSLNASPRTIAKDGQSTLTWSVVYPIPACTLTAKVVCANNSCSPAQTAFETAINTKLTNPEQTDPTDPNGQRLMDTAVKTMAPGHSGSDYKGLGKKTLTKITYTTDFIYDCTAGAKETKRVQVASSQEQ
jgi:hypothetical protein